MAWTHDVKQQLAPLPRERKNLRNFGLMFSAVFMLLAAVSFWKGGTHGWRLAAVSAAFLVAGLAVPGVLKPFHWAWMALAFTLGWFVSRGLLIVAFFLILTPIGLVMRLFGKDFLNERFERNAASYWIPADAPTDKKRYTRSY